MVSWQAAPAQGGGRTHSSNAACERMRMLHQYRPMQSSPSLRTAAAALQHI